MNTQDFGLDSIGDDDIFLSGGFKSQTQAEGTDHRACRKSWIQSPALGAGASKRTKQNCKVCPVPELSCCVNLQKCQPERSRDLPK